MNASFARTFAAGGDLSPWAECVRFRMPAPGCLRFEGRENQPQRLLLSCGIHGDETAPIEMVDRLIEQMRAGSLVPRGDVLCVVGNPEAIAAGKRFVEYDMNRLFDGQWLGNESPGEARRARELEEVTADFAKGAEGGVWHLDLHTTIRPSRIERFAVTRGAVAEKVEEELFLRAAGVGAVVLSPYSRGTYSAFSSRLAGVRSMTLELGQGRGFGENAAEATEDLERVLRAWLEGGLQLTSLLLVGGGKLEPYKVTREILKEAGDFTLHLPAEMENFAPLAPGQMVAEGASGKVMAEEGECVLFPNPNVAVGLRAAVLVRRARV
jgi:succinylglutamate desuccinylase